MEWEYEGVLVFAVVVVGLCSVWSRYPLFSLDISTARATLHILIAFIFLTFSQFSNSSEFLRFPVQKGQKKKNPTPQKSKAPGAPRRAPFLAPMNSGTTTQRP
jgi:hypothetical protein